MSENPDYDIILEPRRSTRFVGASDLQRAFLDAISADTLHHAWLIAGPDSCGKATFAYLAAKFLLTHQANAAAVAADANSFSVPDGSPSAAKISVGSHADLLLFSRRWDQDKKRMTAGIPVDDVRRLTHFLGSTPGEGGWRVVIVDKVDDMAPAAANALLKSLEEPPSKCVFFLLSDNPQRLLPTIRSRCRKAVLPALDRSQMADVLQNVVEGFDQNTFDAIAELASGRVLYAKELMQEGHEDLRKDMQARLEEQPASTRNLHALADALALRGREVLFEEFIDRARMFVHDKAIAVAQLGNENPWIRVWDALNEQQRQTDTYNLDKKQLILNLFALLNKAKFEDARRGA